MIHEILPEFVSAISYFTGGVLFYVVFRLCTALTVKIKPVLRLLPDFLAGLTGGGIFLLVTEFVANGRVAPYSVVCYTSGFLLGAIINTIPASRATDRRNRRRIKEKSKSNN